MPEIDPLLVRMTELGSSDLHLRVGLKPRCRVNGVLDELSDSEALSQEALERLTLEILTTEQKEQFLEARELDFSYGIAEGSRFRCNYFRDHRGSAAVFRRIPAAVPTLKDLHLPTSIESFAHLRRGLVLVTGSSGSGKTSTLAALIDVINCNYSRHIITLEDPIEFLHTSKSSIVHQRGLHYDISDFESGIVAALREDADVILIGELRDLESIRHALAAAETGALVFATLHTNGAADSIDRVIDVFPADEQPQVRTILSQSLAGVISQVLVPRMDQPGRHPATEVLVSTPAVSNLIREHRTQDLVNNIQSGKSQGMHTLEDSLEALVERKIISADEAYLHARNKSRFERLVVVEDALQSRA